jgi:hypothetical protein
MQYYLLDTKMSFGARQKTARFTKIIMSMDMLGQQVHSTTVTIVLLAMLLMGYGQGV